MSGSKRAEQVQQPEACQKWKSEDLDPKDNSAALQRVKAFYSVGNRVIRGQSANGLLGVWGVVVLEGKIYSRRFYNLSIFGDCDVWVTRVINFKQVEVKLSTSQLFY